MTDILSVLSSALGAVKSKLSARRHLLALAAVGAVFLCAALMPLAFINSARDSEQLDYASKAALFCEYWTGSEGGYTVEKIDEPSAELVGFCNERFNELLEQCRVDRAENPEIKMEGSEYVLLRSAENSVGLCRKWIQYSGDWNSWLDVCFDSQTGEVFYLYTNGECIFNSGEYTDTAPGSADARALAEIFADELELELYHYDEAGEGQPASTAIFLCGDTPVKLELSLVYYEGRLFDVKIVCIE